MNPHLHVVSDYPDEYTVTARNTMLPAAGAPEWVMWMPAGTHRINATRGGKPTTLSINVTSADASKMQEALMALKSSGNPDPSCGFDHANGPAAFWPEAFEWRTSPKPGIYVKARWTPNGKAAVTSEPGHSAAYRYFSPTFLVDDQGNLTGLPSSGEIGSLVNNPAFRQMLPIAAGHAGEASDVELEGVFCANGAHRSACASRIMAASVDPISFTSAWEMTSDDEAGDMMLCRALELMAESRARNGFSISFDWAWACAREEQPPQPDPVYDKAVEIQQQAFAAGEAIRWPEAMTRALAS